MTKTDSGHDHPEVESPTEFKCNQSTRSHQSSCMQKLQEESPTTISAETAREVTNNLSSEDKSYR